MPALKILAIILLKDMEMIYSNIQCHFGGSMMSGCSVDTCVLFMFYNMDVSNHSTVLTGFPGV